VPFCLDLIGAAWCDTRPEVVASFRPKSAQRPKNPAAG
jgi:molybdopterin adenylyltransferase